MHGRREAWVGRRHSEKMSGRNGGKKLGGREGERKGGRGAAHRFEERKRMAE